MSVDANDVAPAVSCGPEGNVRQTSPPSKSVCVSVSSCVCSGGWEGVVSTALHGPCLPAQTGPADWVTSRCGKTTRRTGSLSMHLKCVTAVRPSMFSEYKFMIMIVTGHLRAPTEFIVVDTSMCLLKVSCSARKGCMWPVVLNTEPLLYYV